MKTFMIISICALVLLLSSCTKQLITPEELEKLKSDKASLETKNADLQKKTDELQSEVDLHKPNSMLWDQTLQAYKASPVKPALADHYWADLGDGSYLFLETDEDGNELTQYGIALPGNFCMEDAEQLPPTFDHFYLANCAEKDPKMCHGGVGGEEGYWLNHIPAREGLQRPAATSPPPKCVEEEVEENP
ncbi:MAG TPA: hypothetical protein VJG90_02120 [Candidatus Nanoarchaeia archaeon]|nr:hypothetical protein [Candidatus Nanoarchaeia archaeon]